MRGSLGIAACLLVTTGLTTAVLANPLGQATTASGDAFVSACAGNGLSGINQIGDAVNGGQSYSAGSAPGLQAGTCGFQESPTPGAQATTGTITGSGSFEGNTYSNSATATATPTTIHLNAQNSGSTGTDFAGASAQGGFNLTRTPTGGPTGTQAIEEIKVHVDGTLAASGSGAGAQLQLQLYVNGSPLQPYGSAINATAYSSFIAANSAFNPTTNSTQVGVGSIYFSWDSQMQPYWAVGDSSTDSTITVSQDVFFFVPVTFGTPIELGIYADTLAGENANGSPDGANSASVEFANTITWDGLGETLNADGSVDTGANFAFNTVSGQPDYNQSFYTDAPEPLSLGTFGVGLAALGLLRRRRQSGRD